MDQATIILLTNIGAQLIALAIDEYRKTGATEEQLAAERVRALGRVDAAILAVQTAVPPPIVEET